MSAQRDREERQWRDCAGACELPPLLLIGRSASARASRPPAAARRAWKRVETSTSGRRSGRSGKGWRGAAPAADPRTSSCAVRSKVESEARVEPQRLNEVEPAVDDRENLPKEDAPAQLAASSKRLKLSQSTTSVKLGSSELLRCSPPSKLPRASRGGSFALTAAEPSSPRATSRSPASSSTSHVAISGVICAARCVSEAKMSLMKRKVASSPTSERATPDRGLAESNRSSGSARSSAMPSRT